MRAAEKRAERWHILKTIAEIGEPATGITIADATLDPMVSRRAIGQKLSSMALDGLVVGEQRPRRRREHPGRWGTTHYDPDPMLWSITNAGRELLGLPPAPDTGETDEHA